MKRFYLSNFWVIFIFQTGSIFANPVFERIFVQTDKQMYLAGEPVLMKFFTTDSEQIPIVFSKIAYAELVRDSIALLQIKVALTDGTGAGRMLLPADLPTGYYRLIAYTQYMRNEGADVFFEKNIALLNTFQSSYYPNDSKISEFNDSTIQRFEASTVEESSHSGIILQTKTSFATRERGELTIIGLPDNIHTLSVSIAGKECVPVSESDISLFQKNKTKKAEGNVMSANDGIDNLIDELRRGNESAINAYVAARLYQEIQTGEMEFLPEYEGHIVTGRFMDNQTGNPATGDIASLSAGLSFPTADGIRFFSGQKTKTDEVRFYTSSISGTNEIATVVFRADDRYRVDIQSPFVARHAPKMMPALQVDSALYDYLLDRSVALQLFRYFSDDPSEISAILAPHFKMKPSNSYPLDDYTRFTTMRQIFVEFISGARFRRNATGKQELFVFTKRGDVYEYGNMPLVLLDGVPVTDHESIYNYDPLTVEQINIYYGPYKLGSSRFDGIVELITYRRLHADLNLNRSTQVISYEGPQLPYRLNIPDDSNGEHIQNRTPDGRHTLLWTPDVKTNGKTSIRLPFSTSDLTGAFQATVEGITKDGEFIFATAGFHVE